MKDSIKIKLDTKSNIFQNLNGASHEISLFAENDDVFIYNNVTETVPIIVHGNGGSKVLKQFFNHKKIFFWMILKSIKTIIQQDGFESC